jgi:DNA repair protein RadA/Sms
MPVMPKNERPRFYCKHCGNEYARWEGKCPACNEWDALIEAPPEKSDARPRKGGKSESRAASLPSLGARPRPLKDYAAERVPRLPIPIGEFHRVLGGGAVPGGSILVGGEPGIGKSTLLLQVLGALAGEEERPHRTAGSDRPNQTDDPSERSAPASNRRPVANSRPLLYISGEEAPSQIAARGLRLADQPSENGGPRYDFENPNLKLAGETDLETLLQILEDERPRLAVIDSIQTLRDPSVASAPGSVSQVRECALSLVDAARRLEIALFLIGHVTKDGTLAGPRVLEHVVDTVLNFEGDTRLGLRVLRAQKNRFGSTHEVGLFEMSGAGLIEVPDPSSALLDRDGAEDKGAGSTVGALCEGSRVLLVEVQALTVPVPSGGSPRRRATGLDANRLAMLLAVLETKAGVPFGALDVFVSAAGGFDVDEPAADLPVALALSSVATGRKIREGLVSAGEIGLGGELRPVPRVEARLAEAKRLGFTQVLLPARGRAVSAGAPHGLKLLRARTIHEALSVALE